MSAEKSASVRFVKELNAPRVLVIEGANIADIPSFYAEINRVFMADEDWKLGCTLDGLNDLLYGGYGALADAGSAVVIWRNIEASRAALGAEATLEFLRARIEDRSIFNGKSIASQIEALEAGAGTTYFDIVMEIFAEHSNLELRIE